MSKSPEKELGEFLASKPAWMEKALQGDFSSVPLGLESSNNLDKVNELTPEYERILQQIPAEWKKYRKKLKQNYQRLAQTMVPKAKPGRPRDSKAEGYAALHPSESYRQMAKKELRGEPEGEAKKLLIEKEGERIRASVRRARLRKNT